MPAILGADLAQLRRRTSAKWSQYGPDVIPAWVAEMGSTLAEPIAAALHRAVDDSDTGYASHTSALISTFAAFAAAQWSWTIPPARLFTDVGTAITEILRRVVPAGAEVIVTTPVYPSFFQYFHTIGARAREIPLRSVDLSLDLAAIEAAMASGVHTVLLSNPHNPNGRVHTRGELVSLDLLAQRYGATVLADEIHAPLLFPGETFVPYLTVSEHAAATAYAFHSPSKGWNLAGLKCGIALSAHFPSSITDEYLWATGHFGVLASIAAYRDGGPWLAQLTAELSANAAFLSELVAEHLPDARYRPGASTYLAWIDCRATTLGADPAEFFLREARVALSSGPAFGAAGEGCFRINFGTSPDNLRVILERLGDAYRRHQ